MATFTRKTLRLDREQARTLATWLRMAAGTMDTRAAELTADDVNPMLAKGFRDQARRFRDQAGRARALAARLDRWPDDPPAAEVRELRRRA